MRAYQAVLLDRDGTLCRNSVEKARNRDQAIGEIIGRPGYSLTPEAEMEVLVTDSGQGIPPAFRHRPPFGGG